MARAQAKCEECASVPAWLTSFGDLMALLLTFFVLLLSFSSTDQQDFENAIGSLQGALGVLDGDPIVSSPVKLHLPIVKGDIAEARPTMNDAKGELDEAVKEAGQQGTVQVVQGKEGITIKISDRAAFGVGLADIRDEFKSLLSRIGQVINRMPNAVVIEGHTDTSPISNESFPNNHWLSSARSLQVLDYFNYQVGIDRSRMSAMGYGEYRPVDPLADNDSAEARALNRRVEIRILYSETEGEAQPDSVRALIDEYGLGVTE